MEQEKDWFETEDLLIYPANRDWAPEIAAFYAKNKDFLAQFEPKRADSFYTVAGQKKELKEEEEDIRVGSGMRLYLAEKRAPEVICGMVALNNIMWGSMQSCVLAYKIDKDLQGRGYATQAVRRAIEIAFQVLHLHRVEADIMPRNLASIRVVEKCGMEREGYSKGFLEINGKWEDHLRYAAVNPEQEASDTEISESV